MRLSDLAVDAAEREVDAGREGERHDDPRP
jgi:hypothetical protein